MIQLDDKTWVAGDQVAEVSITESEKVAVFMKDGRVTYIGCDYGKGVYRTAKRILDALEKETK